MKLEEFYFNFGASTKNKKLPNVDLTIAMSYDREDTFNTFPSQLNKQTIVHNCHP
jgi:hypothetical protein